MSREHPLLRRLGATVRALRAGRGWSRRDLAERAGLSQRFLADVETGDLRGLVGPELSLPRLFGDAGGLAQGFEEGAGFGVGGEGFVVAFPSRSMPTRATK